MIEIPNFSDNLRRERDLIFKTGKNRVTLPEATMLALTEILEAALVLHPEAREEVFRRAHLAEQSPIKLNLAARKWLGEKE